MRKWKTYQAIIYSANDDFFQNLLGSFTYNLLGPANVWFFYNLLGHVTFGSDRIRTYRGKNEKSSPADSYRLSSPERVPVISFQVGEAGCEGFAWCTVTEGREDMVMSRDK